MHYTLLTEKTVVTTSHKTTAKKKNIYIYIYMYTAAFWGFTSNSSTYMQSDFKSVILHLIVILLHFY
jgi:hypothetical protein